VFAETRVTWQPSPPPPALVLARVSPWHIDPAGRRKTAPTVREPQGRPSTAATPITRQRKTYLCAKDWRIVAESQSHRHDPMGKILTAIWQMLSSGAD
jgi:hypothetical protein